MYIPPLTERCPLFCPRCEIQQRRLLEIHLCSAWLCTYRWSISYKWELILRATGEESYVPCNTYYTDNSVGEPWWHLLVQILGSEIQRINLPVFYWFIETINKQFSKDTLKERKTECASHQYMLISHAIFLPKIKLVFTKLGNLWTWKLIGVTW